MLRAVCSCVLLLLVAPGASGKAGDLFHETFDTMEAWVQSKAKAYDGVAKLEENGLVLPDEARRYGVSAPLKTPWTPGKDLVVQYELRFTENSLECGGAYLKLLSGTPELAQMQESDPFTVMFGPDKCGGTDKVHVIFKHKNPVTNQTIEHHAKKTATVKPGKLPHLYTLVVRQDNSFSVLVDQVEEVKGMLTSADDFDPPFTPAETIPDPDEKKPEDWVDEAKIDDPEAKKPEEWDEDAPAQIVDPESKKPDGWLDDAPLKVPDPEAVKPDDWSDEEDGPWEAPPVENPACKAAGCGEWKAPMIANPAFKGKWHPPKIDNPAFKGVWAPQQIPNPAYFECSNPLAGLEPIGAVAIEVWLYKPKGPKFSNIVIGTDPEAASKFATETWKVSSDAAKAKAEEEAAKAAEEAKKRRIEDGGFMVQLELLYEYAAENPAISIPVVLLVVFLLLKLLFGGKKPQPIPEDKEEKEEKEEEKEEEKKEEEKEEEKEGAKEAEAPARNLRKRAPKGKDSEQKVATKEEMLDDY